MSDTIGTNALPVVTSLITYVNDAIDHDDYSRSQVAGLIEDVDIVDILAAFSMLAYVLCEDLTDVGVIDSPEEYLAGLGARAQQAVTDAG